MKMVIAYLFISAVALAFGCVLCSALKDDGEDTQNETETDDENR